MWEATIDGKPLHFRLYGINNQNFLMRDEETGSWWQQVTGEAILGPLKGRRLRLVPHDELTFATWRSEVRNGRVLRPSPQYAHAYASANWESEIARLPVATRLRDRTLPHRTLIAGITIGQSSKAYPVDNLRAHSPTLDTLGNTPLVLLSGPDGRSLRAFDRRVDGRPLDLFARPDGTLVDATTGSTWDFRGVATSGPLAGHRLTPVPLLLDYWFDWKTYHPQTALMTR